MTAPPTSLGSAAPALGELSDQQRERALALHAVLRQHLESGVPLARAQPPRPCRCAQRSAGSPCTAGMGSRRSRPRRAAIVAGVASPTHKLYSPIGFAHQYRPLSADELRFVLTHHWKTLGLELAA